jgi:hypothetical protein
MNYFESTDTFLRTFIKTSDTISQSRIEDIPKFDAPDSMVFRQQAFICSRLSKRSCLTRKLRLIQTTKAKAKAIAGLALGLRFGHSLGLLHGRLTSNNANRLAEQDWNNSEKVYIGGFSEKCWTLMADIREFAEILSVIAVGASDGQSER